MLTKQEKAQAKTKVCDSELKVMNDTKPIGGKQIFLGILQILLLQVK